MFNAIALTGEDFFKIVSDVDKFLVDCPYFRNHLDRFGISINQNLSSDTFAVTVFDINHAFD